jgi:hypothetical protein
VIVAAGLLVLTGLGLFLAGVLTGTTAFYWACVAVCVLAAVLLVKARRRIARAEAAAPTGGTVAPTTTGPAAPPSDPGPADPGNGEPAAEPAPTGAHASPGVRSSVPATPRNLADPPIEDVEVTDLLLVVDLKDEVLVVDEHPRYHLASCRFLAGRTAVPLPLDEARVDGFTPCALCTPDRHLADRARARRRAPGR